MNEVSLEEVKKIAEEAYIYAFPMLMGYRFAFATFLTPGLPSYRGPANEIHGEASTLDHTFKDVISPNADTPYSFALLDLRAEPVVIQVPHVSDRYYVFQFEDLYGCNAHYIGTRSSGSQAGTYLAVGPRWDGETRGDFASVLTFETDLVFLIGRTQLLGADDLPALKEVMAGYKIQTLSAYRGRPGPAAPPAQWPVWNDEASRDERFISTFNFLLQFCQPVHPSEDALMARFARIGVGPGAKFDPEALDREVRAALRSGVASARETMATKANTLAQKVNGWMSTDVFGPREFYHGDYLLRALGALVGWGGNDKIEAFYPIVREELGGTPLDGALRYQVTFSTPPPARAFWSLTMYDTSYDGTAGYLVANPIKRYLINTNTDGLVYGEDSSLTVTIQHDQPQDPRERANWLPAPTGPFYMILRIYWPAQAALDGTWTPPPVVKG